ncbi:alpha/beta fold hydrolase [uncultured Mycobacterium sp.]|uniref:alpha/beta fold hydrolase n=1 Tax=uncultured Mycobacterium sp. TaxID=171292 RepID=UPI0035C9940B
MAVLRERSDLVDRVSTLEGRADDLRAVLGAAGCEPVTLFGFLGRTDQHPFAATYPQRVRTLVQFGTFPSGLLDDACSPGREKWVEHSVGRRIHFRIPLAWKPSRWNAGIERSGPHLRLTEIVAGFLSIPPAGRCHNR